MVMINSFVCELQAVSIGNGVKVFDTTNIFYSIPSSFNCEKVGRRWQEKHNKEQPAELCDTGKALHRALGHIVFADDKSSLCV